ncbi:hypothetical protein RUM43_011027 [Polyplax serrata]|uniref:Low molecular weight phosphotyrosine protein phosphatase n=1 Tax=Polyplax serrata TaxID=468196 RepID=A0AAN8S0Q2_POLSC
MCEETKTRVLFVCLGNICRSPMAACVFRHLAREKGVDDQWVIHSAGIGGWYVGGPGDNRMLMTLKKHKVTAEHRVRQIRESDFHEFDVIFGMDEENVRDLTKMAPKSCKAKIELFGEHDPKGEKIIRDPYYDTDLKGFEHVFEQCMRCSKAVLDNGIY